MPLLRFFQPLLLPAGVVLLGGLLIRWAAQRHATREEAAGRWDAEGPLQPTPPPDNKTTFLSRVTGRSWPRI